MHWYGTHTIIKKIEMLTFHPPKKVAWHHQWKKGLSAQEKIPTSDEELKVLTYIFFQQDIQP